MPSRRRRRASTDRPAVQPQAPPASPWFIDEAERAMVDGLTPPEAPEPTFRRIQLSSGEWIELPVPRVSTAEMPISAGGIVSQAARADEGVDETWRRLNRASILQQQRRELRAAAYDPDAPLHPTPPAPPLPPGYYCPDEPIEVNDPFRLGAVDSVEELSRRVARAVVEANGARFQCDECDHVSYFAWEAAAKEFAAQHNLKYPDHVGYAACHVQTFRLHAGNYIYPDGSIEEGDAA